MHGSVQERMGLGEWAMLVTLSILWGGSFFFVGVVVDDLPPLTIVVVRVGLAALALWAYILMSGRPLPRNRAAWLAFAGMGLLNNVIPFSLIVWGQREIASGLASILNATTPFFTVLVAGWLLADERISGRKVAGVAIGFGGVVVMIGPAAMAGLGGQVLAQVAILGATLSYALASVFGRRFQTMGIDPVVTSAGQVTASTAMLLPVVLVLERPHTLPLPGVEVIGAMVALAVVSTSLAYILYFRILAASGATNVALVTLLVPVSAIILGALFLDEALAVQHFAGMALIAVGLAAIDGRLFRRRPGT